MTPPAVRIVKADKSVTLPDGTEAVQIGWELEIDGDMGPWRFTNHQKAIDAQLEIISWTDEQITTWRLAHPRYETTEQAIDWLERHDAAKLRWAERSIGR